MSFDEECDLSLLCAYCRDRDGETRDHVFPRSWYPTTTPMNLEKWQVPACSSCNNSKATLEGVVRTWLSASVDSESEGAKGVWESSMRAIDPATGKSKRDSHAKSKARKEFKDVLVKPSKMKISTSDSLINVAGKDAADLGIAADMKKVDKLMQLFALGCFRYLRDRPLNPESKIDIYYSHTPEQINYFEQQVEKAETSRSIGPGFEISMTSAFAELLYPSLLIRIWGKILIRANLVEKTPQNMLLRDTKL